MAMTKKKYVVVESALSLETQRSQKLVFNLSQFWTPSIICMLIFVDMKSGGTKQSSEWFRDQKDLNSGEKGKASSPVT